jgi:LCP family protein required for cell wall assembly
MPIKRVKPELKWKVLSRTTIFFAVLFIISVGAGWGIAGVADFVNVVNNLDSMEPGSEDESLPGSLPERINVLVIGSDNRPGETKARSDVLMVASFDQKTGRVAVVSIPRDTRVQIPGYGYNKVNAAYAFGGAKLSRQVVESLLGVEIPYYVATDFNGFIDIIDTLGGVTIDVEQRMYYPEENINLHAGPQQRLNGEDALGFVRYRHLPLGDIDRVENQKKFLMALADEMLTLKAITKLPQLLPQIQDCVQTNFTGGQLLELARMGTKFDPTQMVVTMLPGDFLELTAGSYWQVRDGLAIGLLDTLIEPGGTPPEWQPTSIDKRPPSSNKDDKDSDDKQPGETEGAKDTKNTGDNSIEDSEKSGSDKDSDSTAGKNVKNNAGSGKQSDTSNKNNTSDEPDWINIKQPGSSDTSTQNDAGDEASNNQSKTGTSTKLTPKANSNRDTDGNSDAG